MRDLTWIKLVIGIFDDEKIKFIDTLEMRNLFICIWIKLLVQAGKTNMDGKICMEHNTAYSMTMLSVIFNRTEQEIKAALELFKELRMIKIDKKGIITIINWEKHQNIEGMAKVREQTRNRVKKYREKKKKEIFFESESNVTVTKESNVNQKYLYDNVTVQNREEEEKEKREDKILEKNRTEENRFSLIHDNILAKVK